MTRKVRIIGDDMYDAIQHAQAASRDAQIQREASQPMSDWGRLMRGQTIGKRSVLRRASVAGLASVNVLRISGKDEDAMQVGITIVQPRVIPEATPGFVLPANIQNASGERDNNELITDAVGQAFIWEQGIAEVRWGMGGVNSKLFADIGNGLMINLIASFVEVRMGLFDPKIGSSNALYVLTAFAGPAHAAPSRAQLTGKRTVLGPAVVSPSFPLPEYAKNVTVIGSVTPTNVSIVFFLDFAATVEVGRWNLNDAVNPPGLPMLIPSGGYYYRLINNGAVLGTFYPIFNLAV